MFLLPQPGVTPGPSLPALGMGCSIAQSMTLNKPLLLRWSVDSVSAVRVTNTALSHSRPGIGVFPGDSVTKYHEDSGWCLSHQNLLPSHSARDWTFSLSISRTQLQVSTLGKDASLPRPPSGGGSLPWSSQALCCTLPDSHPTCTQPLPCMMTSVTPELGTSFTNRTS